MKFRLGSIISEPSAMVNAHESLCTPERWAARGRHHARRERSGAEARALLARVAAQNLPVLLPEIALAEIAAASSRGTGQIALAQRLVGAVRRVPQFEFVPIEHTLGDVAARMSAQYQIRGCDAGYAAMAQQQGEILITLDRQQRERLPAHIVARSPAEEPARMTG